MRLVFLTPFLVGRSAQGSGLFVALGWVMCMRFVVNRSSFSVALSFSFSYTSLLFLLFFFSVSLCDSSVNLCVTSQ